MPSAPPRIAATYAVLAFAWIAFSDRAIEVAFHDPHARDVAQTVKGGVFVAFTSVLLYFLVRRSERGLRALGSELRATVDGMADAVLLVDDQRRIVEVNRAALALFGVSRDELVGPLEEWGRRFAPRSADGTPLPLERYAAVRVLAGEPHARYEAIVRRADGTDVFVSVSASPVRRPDAALFAVTVLRDVTPARRLDEIREEFLSTAAHEFKTPLAVVKAYAQLLEKRCPPGEAHALVVIERQVDRLTRLVQHLLDTSRLRLDQDEGRHERFDVAAVAAEVLERMRAAAPAHELRLAARPSVVVADRDRIARVITSLLDNAVRFSPGGGPVEARVEPDGREVTVSVEDHGVGIAPDRQGRVFERYYRAHAGTSDDYGGLGLGLDMSREIVRRHGGRMWFESTPGVGSTFRFSLPLAREGA